MGELDRLDAIARLLEDDCARTILASTLNESMSATELTETCSASRATVYRRLDDLAERGLVAERTVPDSDGHHRTVYRATLDHVRIDLTEDGLEVTVTKREPAPDRFTNFVEGLYE